ncbi:MAG: carboxypeptidase regulatory-like domain-containing protein [Zavarzinella sp.]|nr:carboxypeptidase regulatory-like domain-containing protein [Zavarzinella sp.]
MAPAMTHTSDQRRWVAAATASLLLAFAGCGPRMYPVHGTVTLEDGTPVTRGLVIFERVEGGPAITARGDIQSDGRYQLSTETPGDGVPAGRYRVSINPLDTSDVPDERKVLPFDVKYLNQKTSGLEFEVKPGATEYSIRLSPPAPKGKSR